MSPKTNDKNLCVCRAENTKREIEPFDKNNTRKWVAESVLWVCGPNDEFSSDLSLSKSFSQMAKNMSDLHKQFCHFVEQSNPYHSYPIHGRLYYNCECAIAALELFPLVGKCLRWHTKHLLNCLRNEWNLFLTSPEKVVCMNITCDCGNSTQCAAVPRWLLSGPWDKNLKWALSAL